MNVLNQSKPEMLHIGWVKHLKTQEEKERFKQQLYASSSVLKILKALVLEEKRALEASETNPSDFDKPNWSEKQAFRNGERRGLKLVEDLLNFI